MKEFIEIPFGAKDSELCGWEYTIPKGFVASIENGKIVVKKEDTDDEDIKSCIAMCLTDANEQRFKDYGTNLKDCIAWLEKQGEQKPAWSEEDENRFSNLIWLIEHSNEGKATKEGFIKFINNLKSLKDRVHLQWKPSEEQIKDFGGALLILKLQHYASSESLESLYEQLKKL